MAVIALKPGYAFPSRSRQELYGTDQLVHVMWKGNFLFAAPATFRVSGSSTWAEFVSSVIEPWAAMDLDFDSSRLRSWQLDGAPFEPDAGSTLESLGVGHKSLVSFEG